MSQSWLTIIQNLEAKRGRILRRSAQEQPVDPTRIEDNGATTGQGLDVAATAEAMGISQEQLEANLEEQARLEREQQYKLPTRDVWGAVGGPAFDRYAAAMNEPASTAAFLYTPIRENPDDMRAAQSDFPDLYRTFQRQGGTAGTSPTTGVKFMAKIKALALTNREELESFQRKLYAAGFYGSTQGGRDQEPMWRLADDPTMAATSALVNMTLSFGGELSLNEVLDMFIAEGDRDKDGKPDGGTGRDGRIRPTVQLTNPADLRVAEQDRAVDLMGRRLGDDEIGTNAGYNGLEAASQNAAADLAMGDGGGTVTQAPSLGAYTEEQMRAQHGDEIGAYAYLGNFNALLQRLGLAG